MREVLNEPVEALCEATADAEADANDEPTLGGWGSGVMLLSSVSQTPSPSGLRLLLRSPSPSNGVRASSRRRLLPERLADGLGLENL